VLAWAALPIACLWLLAALLLWRAYPALLLQASSDRNLAGADTAELLDATTVRALLPGLSDPDPTVCRAAVDLVTDADPAVAVEVLAEGARRAGAATRPMIVEALRRLIEPSEPGALDTNGSARGTIAALLARPSDLGTEERADLYRIYARLTGGARAASDIASVAVLEMALGDREPAVRLAAMAELHRRGMPLPGAADLDRTLRDALTAGDVLVRRSARKELRAMLLSTEPDETWRARFELLTSGLSQRADRAETAEALVEVARRKPPAALLDARRALEWLDDPDPRVRAAGLRFIGHAGLTEEGPRLMAALGSREDAETAAAREGLIALGPDIAHELLVEYEFGTPTCRDGLLAVLSEIDVEPQTLEDGYQRQLAEVRRVVMLRGALGDDHRAAMLKQRLEERVSEGLSALLAYAGVLQDDPRIGELERRLRRARDERRRDILLEALEALLPPAARRELVPLLERGQWSSRAAVAAATLGLTQPSVAEAEAALVSDEEELTARLAGREIGDGVEKDSPLVHSLSMLDPMDVAVRLQNVPAFARLSTRQLVALAGVLVEVSCRAGETLFQEGDEGDGLYIVLEGSVAVVRGDTELARRSPATFFGELSTLDGVPRAVTAIAREDSRLLRMSREDLIGLMEDAPSLAIGLAEFLALRVRELQGKLP
ncbi:MAG: cyclic nucleotide-binding domain-containing protein, partial [Myxococcales bacterium]